MREATMRSAIVARSRFDVAKSLREARMRSAMLHRILASRLRSMHPSFGLRIETSRSATPELREATSRSQGIMDCMRTEDNLPRYLAFQQTEILHFTLTYNGHL